MIFLKRRLFYWLLKAYLKRWGKVILLFFILGLSIFFIFLKTAHIIIPKVPAGHKESIGIMGAYTLDTVPVSILSEISQGLTSISPEGIPTDGIASSWRVENNGKQYTFYLKKDAYFSDGSKVTASAITYQFTDVEIKKPDEYTIVFILKDSYSPFLIRVARPVFKKGFIGTGDYSIRDIKLNGSFIKSLTIRSIKNQYDIKIYHFYPSQESLKIAYLLGEVSKVYGLSDTHFKNLSFKKFSNTEISQHTNYDQLVTLFFNTHDPVVSDEKIRNALSYALPDTFLYGKRNYTPYPPMLWVSTPGLYEKQQDLAHAKLLLSARSATSSASLDLTIKTFSRYKNTVEDIQKAWEKLSIKTSIEIVGAIPSEYQLFLGDFKVPKDPDQYTLWHKDQDNNITKYSNLRIDKLLEDGRKITDYDKRKKIYADFQKYLLADSPATFLYFPYEYSLTRK